MVFTYDSEGNETMIDTMLELPKYTFISEHNVDYYKFYWLVYAGETDPFIDEVFYPQLEVGQEATEWEPVKSSIN